MKLLPDANHSYRLVKKLASVYPVCQHITRTGLLVPADDISIWNWAKTNGYVIVTNDDDFYNLANTYGFPPKVVLLRMGNQSSSSVAATLFKHTDDLQRLADSDEYGILELF